MKSKVSFLFFTLVFAVPVLGNVSSSRKSVVQKSPSVLAQEKQLQKDRQLVLEKKAELEGRMARPLPSAKERQLYEELVQAFERNDELSFSSRFQSMMSEHSKSIYADETLYLGGMMAFANKQYGRAIQLFSRVLKEYPRSGKARAALFAKGAAYKKMNLAPQASTVFSSVKRAFPGSPEARRAEVELRLIK